MSLIEGMTPEEVEKFMNGPAHAPPAHVKPNFHDPKDLSEEFIALCTVSAVITGAFVAMRFYTRWIRVRRFIYEDFILLAGWIIFVTGINTTIYQATYYHLGAHQWDIQVKNFSNYLRLFHYGTLLFCVTMLLLRVAIIMQVLRHFVPQGTRNFTFWAAHLLIYTNAIFWFAVTMMELFSCRPRQKVWDFWIEGKCMDRHQYLIASGVMNLSSELLIMFLPQRVIWGLSLSTKQKLELTPLFLVGTFTCICSAVRLWQTIYQWPTDDLSYYVADAIMLWTVPEIACSVIVPCLPSLPQFIRIIKKKPGGRSAADMFQIPGSPGKSPRRTTRSFTDRNKTVPTVISDMEYHELVMRTETTVASVERENRGPWVQPPATVHITGGRGPTKTFTAPSPYAHFPR